MTANNNAARTNSIKSLPTLKLFIGGVEAADYGMGQRQSAAIMTWLAEKQRKPPPPKPKPARVPPDAATDINVADFVEIVMVDGEERSRVDIDAFKAARALQQDLRAAVAGSPAATNIGRQVTGSGSPSPPAPSQPAAAATAADPKAAACAAVGTCSACVSRPSPCFVRELRQQLSMALSL